MTRLDDAIAELAGFNDDPAAGGITREVYTPTYRAALDRVAGLDAGRGPRRCGSTPSATCSAAGTGAEPGAPRVLTGSHVDTTLNAGRYDGVLGVLGAIEAVRRAARARASRRGGRSSWSPGRGRSRASAPAASAAARPPGALARADLDALRDRGGVSMAAALRDGGLRPRPAGRGARSTRRPCTRSSSCTSSRAPCSRPRATQIGVVTAIAAPHDFRWCCAARPTHAGATPMGLRRDALAGAAEAMLDARAARARVAERHDGRHRRRRARAARRDQRRARRGRARRRRARLRPRRARAAVVEDVARRRRARSRPRAGWSSRSRRSSRTRPWPATDAVVDAAEAAVRRAGPARPAHDQRRLPRRDDPGRARADRDDLRAERAAASATTPTSTPRPRTSTAACGCSPARWRGWRHEAGRACSRSRAATPSPTSWSRARGSSPRFTREWLDGDVAVADGRIAGIGRYDGGERIDGRAAARSCRASSTRTCTSSPPSCCPPEFARVVVARGTTAVVCDPHEIANVLGADGARWLLDASRRAAAARLRDGAVVRARPARSSRRAARSGPADMARILRARAGDRRRRGDGLPVGDRGRPGRAREGRAAPARRRPRAGRAPAARSTPTRRPGSAPTTRRRRGRRRSRSAGAGIWVLLREASNARNLERRCSSSSAATGPSTARSARTTASPTCCCARATSTRCAARRSREGIAPEDVLVMATLHPARAATGSPTSARSRPATTPTWSLLDDLEGFARGARDRRRPRRGARRRGAAVRGARRCPDWVRDTVRIAPLGARRRSTSARRRRARARDRDRPRPADHRRRRRSRRRVARRPRRRRPGARPRQARRRRAPPRDGPRRRRARARLRPAARRVRLDRRARRAQHRRRRRRRREHGRLRASGWPSWAAGSPSPTAERSAASSRCRSRGCCPRSRPRRSSSGSTSSSRCCAEQGVGSTRRS